MCPVLISSTSMVNRRRPELDVLRGTTSVRGLRVGSVAKEHQFGETHFGRLTMSGGSLSVIGHHGLKIGRERETNPFGGDYNKNSVLSTPPITPFGEIRLAPHRTSAPMASPMGQSIKPTTTSGEPTSATWSREAKSL